MGYPVHLGLDVMYSLTTFESGWATNEATWNIQVAHPVATSNFSLFPSQNKSHEIHESAPVQPSLCFSLSQPLA